jgi:hypothetical protein
VFHSISFEKVNANFARFVIDFLSMLLLFDAYTDHNVNASPAPWAGRIFFNEQAGNDPREPIGSHQVLFETE